jgi:hypothetical protein
VIFGVGEAPGAACDECGVLLLSGTTTCPVCALHARVEALEASRVPDARRPVVEPAGQYPRCPECVRRHPRDLSCWGAVEAGKVSP